MRAHIVKDGVVTNTIIVDSLDVLPGLIDADMYGGGVGWSWDGEKITPPTPAPEPPAPVPTEVTMRQARLALLGAGLLANVDAAIDAMPEPTKSAARIEWDYSSAVQRYNGFVAQLGPALGLSEAQVDDLFRVAATL